MSVDSPIPAPSRSLVSIEGYPFFAEKLTISHDIDRNLVASATGGNKYTTTQSNHTVDMVLTGLHVLTEMKSLSTRNDKLNVKVKDMRLSKKAEIDDAVISDIVADRSPPRTTVKVSLVGTKLVDQKI